MKVLLLNGSPRKNGNTSNVLSLIKKEFNDLSVEVEIIDVGTVPIRGCLACSSCKKTGKCIVDDIVNEVAPKFKEADGVIAASPVYYALPNGNLISFLQRLFYSTSFSKRMKVGASIAIARRAGAITTFDALSHFFTIAEMPIVSSRYYNVGYGQKEGEVFEDEEGIDTFKVLAKNMVFLMESIKDGKEKGKLKDNPNKPHTNFIR